MSPEGDALRAGFAKLPIARQIQFVFPAEPDWAAVPDAVLVELVRDYKRVGRDSDGIRRFSLQTVV
ncbi:MAG: hypothetical protein PHI11_10480 [Gallionella sp.]|nr:hypothetical protein [Gallionella sp.]